jgi:glyoxylase I family protein
MREVRFHHISLTCPDSIAVEQFYRRHFGFVRARVIALGEGQIVFIRNREMYLELFQATAAAPIAPADGDGYPWPSVAISLSLWITSRPSSLPWVPMRTWCSDRSVLIRSYRVGDPCGCAIRPATVQITQGFTDQTDPPPPLPRA